MYIRSYIDTVIHIHNEMMETSVWLAVLGLVSDWVSCCWSSLTDCESSCTTRSLASSCPRSCTISASLSVICRSLSRRRLCSNVCRARDVCSVNDDSDVSVLTLSLSDPVDAFTAVTRPATHRECVRDQPCYDDKHYHLEHWSQSHQVTTNHVTRKLGRNWLNDVI